MKAITLHQPWASLVALGVKRIETRSWPAPKALIGQRLAIHAAIRRPDSGWSGGGWSIDGDGELVHRIELADEARALPLGDIVASATVTACVPTVDDTGTHDDEVYRTIGGNGLFRQQVIGDPRVPSSIRQTDLTDQLPYGDFTLGRWAWLLDDIAPTTERCPWCWGTEYDPVTGTGSEERKLYPCRVCVGYGQRSPIPAKGRQGLWNWEPA